MVSWAFPLDGVQAVGPQLRWPGGRLTLQAGCDGFEVMTLFIAAMLVADVPWRRGVVGLLLGCAGIWLLNQLRLLALYASFRYARDWLDPVHTVWGPLLLVGLIGGLYAAIVWRPRGVTSPHTVAQAGAGTLQIQPLRFLCARGAGVSRGHLWQTSARPYGC